MVGINPMIFTNSAEISPIRNGAKRTIKDSVFRNLFSQKKYLLQLYQALHPEDKNVTKADLEYVTLQNIMINADYNDLGFLIGNRLMILVEAQATWCVDIIVRCVMYLAQTWKDYFIRTKQSVYSTTPLNFPEPELYVVYTGDEVIEKKVIQLSEEFFNGRRIAVEATIKVITGSDADDILSQYIVFAKIVDAQRKLYPGNSRRAVTEAIRICKNKNILKTYLEEREKEVVDIMVTLYSQEEAVEQYVISKQFEAEIKSAVQSCRDFGKTVTEAISYLMKRFGFSEARSQKEVEKYWNL